MVNELFRAGTIRHHEITERRTAIAHGHIKTDLSMRTFGELTVLFRNGSMGADRHTNVALVVRKVATGALACPLVGIGTQARAMCILVPGHAVQEADLRLLQEVLGINAFTE